MLLILLDIIDEYRKVQAAVAMPKHNTAFSHNLGQIRRSG